MRFAEFHIFLYHILLPQTFLVSLLLVAMLRNVNMNICELENMEELSKEIIMLIPIELCTHSGSKVYPCHGIQGGLYYLEPQSCGTSDMHCNRTVQIIRAQVQKQAPRHLNFRT
jgi:hypothetical protein